jgi:hypothetical protein
VAQRTSGGNSEMASSFPHKQSATKQQRREHGDRWPAFEKGLREGAETLKRSSCET